MSELKSLREARCTALIMGRVGQHEGLQCGLEEGHERSHRFMAPGRHTALVARWSGA
jgi:hypothetical protein